MENNVLVPKPHRILSMLKHTATECTFRVACENDPAYGQFFMLSLPKVGEAPISASGKGPGYVEFTIRNVGLLTRRFSIWSRETLYSCGDPTAIHSR